MNPLYLQAKETIHFQFTVRFFVVLEFCSFSSYIGWFYEVRSYFLQFLHNNHQTKSTLKRKKASLNEMKKKNASILGVVVVLSEYG